MSGNLRELNRKLTRRIGRLVVTITPEGIELRGYRCSARRKLVTWEQVASLADCRDLLAAAETAAGRDELGRLKALERSQ